MTVRNTQAATLVETGSDRAIAGTVNAQTEAFAELLLSSGTYLSVDGSQIVDTVVDSATLTAEANSGLLTSTSAPLMVEGKAENRPTLVDALEFVLCDSDGVAIAYLHDAFDRSYLATLSDVGGGSFSIHVKSDNYTLIGLDKIVRVRLGGTDIGAFRIESVDASFADEVMSTAKVKGRGLLADLETAIVYNDGVEKERSWTATTCAAIFTELIAEASARGCMLPIVSFSTGNDSLGNPFGESVSFKVDTGTTLLDVARKLHVLADFDVAVSPDYELRAYVEEGGYDTEIRLRIGHNVSVFDTSDTATEKITAVLVESDSGFVEIERTATRRIEAYLNATREASAKASELANLLLDKSEIPIRKYKVSTKLIKPFVDVALGDYVWIPGESSAFRIVQLSIADGSEPNEIDSEIQLNARRTEWLQKVDYAIRQDNAAIGRATGSNLASKAEATGGGGGGASPHTHVEADITDLSYDARKIRGRAIQTGTPSDGVTLKYVHSALEWQYQAFLSQISQLLDVAITSPTSADILRYNGTAWANTTLSGAGIAATSHTHTGQSVIAKAGTLALETGTMRIYNQTGRTLSISKLHASVGTASGGADITLQVRYDGSGDIGSPVTVASGANTGSQTLGSAFSWTDGHYLTLNITQVGSSTAGSDLVMVVVYS